MKIHFELEVSELLVPSMSLKFLQLEALPEFLDSRLLKIQDFVDLSRVLFVSEIYGAIRIPQIVDQLRLPTFFELRPGEATIINHCSNQFKSNRFKSIIGSLLSHDKVFANSPE